MSLMKLKNDALECNDVQSEDRCFNFSVHVISCH